jgi:hypothetical protein
VGWKPIQGHLYYYRSVRQGRRVRSVYCGGGELGRLAAEEDAIGRQIRENWRLEGRLELADACEDDTLQRELDDLVASAREAAAAVLEAAGYHQHDRSEWRKRRDSRDRETGRPREVDGPSSRRPVSGSDEG